MSEQILRELADAAMAQEPDLANAARADLVAILDRDPACHRLMQPLLFFKGFQAIQSSTALVIGCGGKGAAILLILSRCG